MSIHFPSETTGDSAVALWNPAAAANWSLLFSPIFGALIHMKNWEALGKPEEAERAKRWAVGSSIFFFVLIVSGFLLPDSKAIDGWGRICAFVLLIAWYAAHAKEQMQFVTYSYGKDYARRGWGEPLMYGALGFVAVLVAAGVAGAVVGFAEAGR